MRVEGIPVEFGLQLFNSSIASSISSGGGAIFLRPGTRYDHVIPLETTGKTIAMVVSFQWSLSL